MMRFEHETLLADAIYHVIEDSGASDDGRRICIKCGAEQVITGTRPLDAVQPIRKSLRKLDKRQPYPIL